MPSHTANRLWHCDIDSDLDGFVSWGIDNDIPVWLLSFLRLKPELLNTFDPDKRENATERVWEMVARSLGDAPPYQMVYKVAAGYVGDGPAGVLAAFYKNLAEMPDPDAVLLDPKGHPIPAKLDVRYALCGALADRADVNNFDRVVTFVDRLDQKEMTIYTVRDAVQRKPELTKTRTFIEFATKNAGAF
jgi:hypothetical protein